ncbi:carbohydrate kinase [Paenarthrobacter sp. AR 02]|uniref:PfkB domain protein n=1 Tax=Pseudarthrobacter chlorophenolicus (strain ATCC 700700 / DSM 12829 / CIP 107037 / JCM 12360 / KCTC 9906 / NCIMB 13794 / A6) TaxID=452863 RepID=B8HJF8_PSECP|nr:carbohydrate kinase [Paenarthrobacter sp. AR 02]ACL42556.1 PfkB domain protein [Pseudarthrobacter chlorophenolicus A6]MCF3140857.1 carbohydrate kinase [Paenarthrobacter sp. AR 02]SDQ08953.1 fructokinase [Pseudarthrobacter chlorophenolicus]
MPTASPDAYPRVTVIGESLVDVITHPHKTGTSTAIRPGGSPLNVAIGCARLGMTTSLITHYGQDQYGGMIEKHLTANGVAALVGGHSPTSVATANIDHAGAARYSIAITWDLNGTSLPALSAVESSRHVHAGSIATVLPPGRDTVYTLLQAARGRATISYDPNCRPAISGDVHSTRRDIERFVAASDIVKASNEDLEWLYPDRTPDQTAHAWLKLGPAIVAVTRGEGGPVITNGRTMVQMPAREIEVADTVGAGDSFMAALISWLGTRNLLGAGAREKLKDLSPQALQNLLDYANGAASITCSRPGADPPWARELSDLFAAPADFRSVH